MPTLTKTLRLMRQGFNEQISRLDRLATAMEMLAASTEQFVKEYKRSKPVTN